VINLKKYILNPVSMILIGGVLGILSKLFDIHSEILGNIFSEFSIWILLGVLICIYSNSKKKAMINIFLFCIGMLITYYITAEITNSVYSMTFIKGWSIFAFISPIFAYFTWTTKEEGIISKIISLGIIMVTFLLSTIIFNVGIFDLIVIGILIYYLFFKKIERF